VSSSIPEKKPRRRWQKFLPLLGLALLAWILYRADRAAMLAALRPLSLGSVAIAVVFFAVNILLKAVRWSRMLSAQGIDLSFSVAIAAFLNGQFYGQITVGRVGEFYRAEALLQNNVSVGRAMSSCLFDRLLDVTMVLSLATILGAFVVGDFRSAAWAGMMLGVLVLGGVAAIVAIKIAYAQRSHPHLVRVRAMIETRPLLRKLVRSVLELIESSKSLLRPIPLLETLFWTGISWVNYYATLWQLASSMELTATRASLTAAASMAALTALLPISISGLGMREVVFAKVLGTSGTSMESAVVLSLANLAVITFTALALGLIGVIWRGHQLKTKR
jgi:glycosyltransferase 2 family protein